MTADTYSAFTHFAVANDENGKPFVWGFFHSLFAAKKALLPETWVIDEDGKKLAEYTKRIRHAPHS